MLQRTDKLISQFYFSQIMTFFSWKTALLNDARNTPFEQQVLQTSDYVLEYFWETHWPPIIESLLGYPRKPVQSEKLAA